MPNRAFEAAVKRDDAFDRWMKAKADQKAEFKDKDLAKLTPGEQERYTNLEVGASRLQHQFQEAEEEWKSATLDGLEDGSIHGESGSEPDGKRKDIHPDGLRRGSIGEFAKTIVDAGFSLTKKPSVEVPLATALGVKANTFPAVTGWREGVSPLTPLGQDRRWLYPNLVTQNAARLAVIEDFKQTARALVGTVERELDATTDKANVDVTLTLVTEKLKQFAVTINDVPNAILESISSLPAWLEAEGRFQVEKGLDAHVFAQIVAAGPPFGNTGTGLIAQLRNGVASMRAEGANPTIAVLNPTEAATLDLSTDAGGLVFGTRDSGSSSPLWGLRIVERTSTAGNEPPYLIDPQMLGVLFLGTIRFDADPFTSFKKNLTTVRFETKALFHVRDAKGARRIAAT